jgi:hypothetical protein
MSDLTILNFASFTVTVKDSSGATVTDATLTLRDSSNATISPTSPGSYTYQGLDPDGTYSLQATKTHASTGSGSAFSSGFTEGRTITAIGLNPGTNTITVEMQTPADSVACSSVSSCPT